VDVSQISMPIRILLVGAVVAVAAWFTVLKPKPVTAELDAPAQTAAQTAYGKAVAKAKNVAAKAVATTTPAAAESNGAAAPAATPEPAAQPAVAIPDEELAKLPTTVAAALKEHKILVLGVFADGATNWRPMADDDRYVRNALRKTNRYDGDVVVKHVDISKLSTYGSLVNDLDVVQSPSVVVIDRELKGRVLTGYVDRISINQTIADARDATTTPNITDPYLREVNAFCGDYKLRFSRLSKPTVRGRKPFLAAMNRAAESARVYRRKFTAIEAPAKWRSLRAQYLRNLVADELLTSAMVKSVKQKDVASALVILALADMTDARALDRRFNKVGLTNCASNRRS
jgi:hypothetical protein